MAVLCHQIVSPFLTLMVWAIPVLTLDTLHQSLARNMSGQHCRENNDDSPTPAVR